MKNGKMEYYERYFYNYIQASPEIRKASKEHWQRVHVENMKTGRDDLILFSGKMLGSIIQAEKYLSEYVAKAN